MQFLPDSTQRFTLPEDFRASFGFIYSGPGSYLTALDTLLVICPLRGRETYWNQEVKVGEIFEAHVWNVPYGHTTLSVLSECPNRSDYRAGDTLFYRKMKGVYE